MAVRAAGSVTAFVRVALAVVVVVTLSTAGCSAIPGSGPGPTVTTVVTAPVQGGVGQSGAIADPHESPDRGPEPAEPDRIPSAESTAFERIAADLPPGTGMAIAPIGRPDPGRTAGDIDSEVAWSTVKVPLAIAALRISPNLADIAHQSITVSDNASAETLWAALGGGQGAATAVEQILAQAGDDHTRVPSSRLRPGFSIFGQTHWALDDQARFAAGLACLPDADPVLAMMAQIDPSQQWGLGRIPGATFKGGWGPTTDGSGYLVRQFGLIPTAGGRAGIALATYAPDLSSGAAQLSRLADIIAAEAGALGGGDCR